MLRELIRTDFGIDLPIKGDYSSRDDPLCIETAAPDHASRVEMEFARCIYRKLNIHWHTVAKELICIDEKVIERVTHEVRYLDGDNVVTGKRSQYFDVSMAMGELRQPTPRCEIDLGELAPFNFPYQLGWVNYSSLASYEDIGPGMGISLLYGAPFIKLTVYIYNKEHDLIDCHATPELFRAEFDSAVKDVVTVYPQAEAGAESLGDDVLFKAFSVDSAYTCVMLKTARNYFFKVRATLDGSNDEYVFKCLMESLSFIDSLIH